MYAEEGRLRYDEAWAADRKASHVSVTDGKSWMVDGKWQVTKNNKK